MPIPAQPLVNPLYELAGRLRLYPDWYPLHRWDITSAELNNLTIARSRNEREAAVILAKRYQIPEWLAINQITPIKLEEWLGLGGDEFITRYGYPDLIKSAIALEVEEIVRARKAKQDEEDMNRKEIQTSPVLSALATGAAGGVLNKGYR